MADLLNAVKDALIARRELERLTGLGRTAVYARINRKSPQYDPSFPRPVSLGDTTSVRWSLRETEAWIQARIAERDNRQAA